MDTRKNIELYLKEFFTLNPSSELKPDILKLKSDEKMLFNIYLDEFNSMKGIHDFESSFPYLFERYSQLRGYIDNHKQLYNKYPKEYGITPLMLCVSCIAHAGNTIDEILQMHEKEAAGHLQKGSPINATDIHGRTALFYPAIAEEFINDATNHKRIYENFVPLLLKYGADPTIKDKHGKTALDYYEIYGYKNSSVIPLLKQAMENAKQNQNLEKPLFKLFDGSTYTPKQTDESPRPGKK